MTKSTNTPLILTPLLLIANCRATPDRGAGPDE